MKITGKIKSITPVLTHAEPTDLMYAGEVESGKTIIASLAFANTGNVQQTVTMGTPSGLVNCSLSGEGKFVTGPASTPTPIPNVAVLEPNQDCIYKFGIKVNEIPVGAPMEDFELNIDWTWS